jgi:hypothetical protein
MIGFLPTSWEKESRVENSSEQVHNFKGPTCLDMEYEQAYFYLKNKWDPGKYTTNRGLPIQRKIALSAFSQNKKESEKCD